MNEFRNVATLRLSYAMGRFLSDELTFCPEQNIIGRKEGALDERGSYEIV